MCEFKNITLPETMICLTSVGVMLGYEQNDPGHFNTSYKGEFQYQKGDFNPANIQKNKDNLEKVNIRLQHGETPFPQKQRYILHKYSE